MATTTAKGIPFPQDGDPLRDGANAIQQLAQWINDHLPARIMRGTLAINTAAYPWGAGTPNVPWSGALVTLANVPAGSFAQASIRSMAPIGTQSTSLRVVNGTIYAINIGQRVDTGSFTVDWEWTA